MVKLGKSSKQGGCLSVGREFPTFLTGKTVMNGKYPKHPETSRKAIQISKQNFDMLKIGGGEEGFRGLELFPSLTVFFLKASLNVYSSFSRKPKCS